MSVLVISLFYFFWILSGLLMFIFWNKWRSTENKYSLIEIVSPRSHCSAFMLTYALIPTVTVGFLTSLRLLEQSKITTV